ncbi:MAG: hypothetical protein GC199_01200 [Alphaproteobacteria bacterium]|nr:hypothetical protein [Alphaproteobacteria bacterium]
MRSQHWVLIVALGIALPALAGCGFSPLYGKTQAYGSMQNEFQQISVAEMPSRLGLTFRNSMIDLLSPGGEPVNPRYRLVVNLKETLTPLAIQTDASATRYNYKLVANYELREVDSGSVIDAGEARAIAAYNVVDSQFATLSARKDAQERAAKDLAQSIRLRLGVGFEQRASRLGSAG